jgi:hypothetical protein
VGDPGDLTPNTPGNNPITCAIGDLDCDGVLDNAPDNCLKDYNPDQADSGGDNVGDVCDNGDRVANPDQKDDDGDGLGNACDSKWQDSDKDGIGDTKDNCPNTVNPDQLDSDGDGKGDVCDMCNNVDSDEDNDGYPDANCVSGTDCNDKDASINPGAAEICTDGVDNDCDTKVDVNDASECQKSGPLIQPYTPPLLTTQQPSPTNAQANDGTLIRAIEETLSHMSQSARVANSNLDAIGRYGKNAQTAELQKVRGDLDYLSEQIDDITKKLAAGSYGTTDEDVKKNIKNRVQDLSNQNDLVQAGVLGIMQDLL